MTLARATISGIVVKNPEKRFTTNNIAVVTFSIDFSDANNPDQVVLARAVGNLADRIEKIVKRGSKIVVEGRLQLLSIKTSDEGFDKKVAEIEISSFECLSSGNSNQEDLSSSAENDKFVKFGEDEEEFADDLIGEDEIPF